MDNVAVGTAGTRETAGTTGTRETAETAEKYYIVMMTLCFAVVSFVSVVSVVSKKTSSAHNPISCQKVAQSNGLQWVTISYYEQSGIDNKNIVTHNNS